MPVAYVQLRKGATAGSDELLAMCRKEIVERAAVPTDVIIIDEMPVTAVGKIFKPALRADATRRIVTETVGRILGCDEAVIQYVEAKTQLHVRIRLPERLDDEDTRRTLLAALSGYNFETTIAAESA